MFKSLIQTPKNEITMFEHIPPSLEEHQLSKTQIIEQSLPIALRKRTWECTKRLLYLLAHYLSFKKFLPSLRRFLTGLNEILNPKHCLRKNRGKSWKLRWMHWKKKKGTWEIVYLTKEKMHYDVRKSYDFGLCGNFL